MNIVNVCNKIAVLLKKPEYFFLAAASLFGLLFSLIIPPFQTPDEIVHFYRAYEVSELGANRTEKDHAMGSMLPTSIAKTQHVINAETDTPTHIQFNPYNKYSLHYTKQALGIPLNQNDKQFYRTETYPMIVYLPQAFAVAVGKVFNAPILVMIYLARLVNLVVWVAVVFLCIRYFPWKKWALVGVCLLPVVVAQTISPGLDVLAIASTLVFLTLVFNGIYDRRYKFATKQLLLIVLAAVLMAFTKSTLVVFLPLIFLIKRDQILFRYANIAKIVILLLPIVSFALWTMSMPTLEVSDVIPSSSQQISIFLHNPLHFIHLLLNTGFFVTISGNALAQSIVGDFGWLDTPLSPFLTYLGVMYIGFLLIVGISKDKQGISKNVRLYMLLVTIGSVLATFLAMYVYSTLPSDNHIKGVQGRYLVPAIIMLIPILLNNQIVTSKILFMRIVRVGSVVFLGVSMLTIIARYYYVFIPT